MGKTVVAPDLFAFLPPYGLKKPGPYLKRLPHRVTPPTPALSLPREPVAFVRACLTEWGKAHDCERRAQCMSTKLEGLDSPQAQRERLQQLELVDYHRQRMEHMVLALTSRIPPFPPHGNIDR